MYFGKRKRISAIVPLGFRTPELSWTLNGAAITLQSHPLHAETLYRDPFGVLTEALDIRVATHTTQGRYEAIATNMGGQAKVAFTITLVGN